MRFLVILALLLSGCTTGYDRYALVDGDLLLVEKIRSYGSIKSIITKDSTEVDTKQDLKLLDINLQKASAL